MHSVSLSSLEPALLRFGRLLALVLLAGVGTLACSDSGGDGPVDVPDGGDAGPPPRGPCAGLADGDSCDDGDPCTTGEACDANECVGGLPTDCSHLDDACNVGKCNGETGACEAEPVAAGTACDDGDLCTVGDACVEGACGAGEPKDCSDAGGDCTVGVCNPNSGVCESQPLQDGGDCDDLNPCTTGDVCTGGTCVGEDLDCSDLEDPCHAGMCDVSTGQCVQVQLENGTACDDTNPCTLGDICIGGACVGEILDCSDLNDECLVGTCDDDTGDCTVTEKPDSAPCDDGEGCTVNDSCTAGECAGETLECGFLDGPCARGECDPVAGSCRSISVNDGLPCTDEDPCTAGAVCFGGLCGRVKDCAEVANACNEGECDPQTGDCVAVPANEGEACDDDDLCSSGDACDDGACVGTEVDCSGLDDGCLSGICLTATGECTAVAVPDGTPCDDGEAGTGGDRCLAGECAGCIPDAADPGDDNLAGARAWGGTPMTGTVCPGDVDLYSITLASTLGLQVEIDGGEGVRCDLAARIELRDASGAVMGGVGGSGADQCPTLDPRVHDFARGLAPGTWYVAISGLRGFDSGDYRVTLSTLDVVGGNEVEPNDSTDEAAGPITAIGAFTGEVDEAGDLDFFEISTVGGARVTATISDGLGGCDFDTVLELYGDDGDALIASDDDNGPGLCSRLEVVVPGGVYYLVAGGFLGTTGLYRLDVSVESVDGLFETEPNDTVPQAQPAADVRGLINPAADVDIYEVELAAGELLEVRVGGGGQPCLIAESFDSPADPRLSVTLWDSDGTTMIAMDSDSSAAGCPFLGPALNAAVAALTAGTYYVSVQGTDLGRGGPYELRVDRLSGEAEPNDDPAQAIAIDVTNGPQVLIGELENDADIDYYTFTLAQPSSALILLDDGASGCDGDPLIEVQLPGSLTTVAFDEDDGPDACPALDPGRDHVVRRLQAGAYLIKVQTLASSPGSYVLHLDVGDAFPVETEPNEDAAASNGPFSGDFEVYGQLNVQSDQDWYRFELTEARSMTAIVDNGAQLCGVDAVMRLWADDGSRLLAQNGDGATRAGVCPGFFPSQLLPLRNLDAGEYWVQIAAERPPGVGPYRLDVNFGDPVISEVENNDSFTEASGPYLGDVDVFADIDPAGDVDFFQVELPRGGSLWATTTEELDGCATDTFITLLADDGATVLATDDDDGPGLCSLIDPRGQDSGAAGLDPGVYYIQVRGFGPATLGRYVLKLRFLP